MSTMPPSSSPEEQLRAENSELRERLEKVEGRLRAIRSGEVEGPVVENGGGPQVFTLQGLDAGSNRLHSEILAQVSDSVIAVDREDRITFFNTAAERQYGFRSDQVLGRRISEIYTRHWPKPEAEAARYKALREHGEWRGESVQRLHDGRELHVESSVAMLRGADGANEGTVAAIRDITARKQAEADLRQSEYFLQRVTDVTPGVIHVFDLEKQCSVFANRSVAGVMGYTPQEIGAMGADVVPMLMHPEDFARFPAHLERVRALRDDGIAEFEHRMRDKSGRWHWFHSRDAVFKRDADGSVCQLIGTAIEITAMKQTQMELADATRRFQFALRSAPVTLFHQDPDLHYTWIYNPAFGYNSEEVIGKRDGDLFERAQDAANTEAMKREVMRTGAGERRDVLVHAEGVDHYFDLLVEPLVDKGGSITGVTCAAIEVTERRRTEEALRDSEARYRSLFENMLDGFAYCQMLFDEHGQPHDFVYLAVNEIFGELTGLENVIGKRVTEVIPGISELHPEVFETYGRVASTGNPERFEIDFKPWGLRLSISVYCPMKGYFVAVFDDITERVRAEAEIRNNEELVRTIAENSTQAMVMIDERGFVTYCNQVLLNLTGYNAEEIRSAPLHDLIHHHYPDGRPYPVKECPIDRALPENFSVRAHDDLFFRKDGSSFEVLCAASPIFKDGKPVSTVIEVRDVTEQNAARRELTQTLTERKQAEEALRESDERTRLATEATAVGIWERNVHTGALRWDAQMFRLYGIAPTVDGWVQYSDWSGAVLPEDLPENERILQDTVRTCGQSRREFRIHRRDDGAVRDIESVETVRANAQGEIEWVVGTNLDVTERKTAEIQLQRLAADLSEADRRKDEFLATLAHELRNPLAPIRTGLQLMKMPGVPAATVEQTRCMMDRQLTHMVRLIDDLMDVSRITRGKLVLRKEHVPLAAVVNSAVEASRPLVEQAGQELTVTLPRQPLMVDADLTRLAQVFLNLLNNAAKYSDPGGQIRLIVEPQGSEVVVTVKDTGIGIAANQLPHIFQMFTQVDRSLERSQGGLGIGLTLVNRLVEMHGGSVEATSEGPGNGSEFVVRLPLVIEASKPQEPGGAAEPSVRSSLRILVVDDNQDGADSLSEMLKIMGNDTRTAYDGQAAVDAAGEFGPNVILLDIGLPKLNGYEACRRIREQPGGERIVLIAVTGWGQDDDRRRSHVAGFDHHMVKPVDPRALMELLAGLDVGR